MSLLLESNTPGFTLISYRDDIKGVCIQVTTSKHGILQTISLTKEEAKMLAFDLYEFGKNQEVPVAEVRGPIKT